MRDTAIVLAAGRGRRLGGRKLERPWRGYPTVLEATLACYRGLVDDLIVVLGHESDRLEPVAARAGARGVVNEQYDQGMLSSVWCGLRAVGEVEFAWLTPGDIPGVRRETIAALRAGWRAGDGLVIPTCDGRRGHPLMLAADLFGEVFQLAPEVGLRQLREQVPERVRLVEVGDPGILHDLDTPADLERPPP